MNIEQIFELPNFRTQLGELRKNKTEKSTEDWWKEFNGKHSILTDITRKDEYVGVGNDKRLVKKAKEIVTFQKKITNTAIAFMFGKPVKLSMRNEEEAIEEPFNSLKQMWRDTKLDYFNRELMRHGSVETEVAELWYVEEAETGFKPRVKLISEKEGYAFYPNWSGTGDMDAFVVEFKKADATGKKNLDCVAIYTAAEITEAVKTSSDWEVETKPNPFGKIPAVLYQQDAREWGDVQTLIDRLEMMISRHADTNDYFAGPILKVWGKLKEAPNKSQDAKSLQFDADFDDDGKERKADAEYLTWMHTPESLKLEYNIIRELIYELTHTPEISFGKVKGLGNVSGIALTLLFLDPIIKAMNKEEIYGKGLQRRVNLMKAILGTIDTSKKKLYDQLDVDIEFQSILPNNIPEVVSTLADAKVAGIISTSEAIRQNPQVSNAQQVEGELKSEASLQGGSFEL